MADPTTSTATQKPQLPVVTTLSDPVGPLSSKPVVKGPTPIDSSASTPDSGSGEPNAGSAARVAASRRGRIVGIGIILAVLFYFLVWRQIEALHYQLLALVAAAGVFALFVVGYLARTKPLFASIRNLIVVFVITFGAAGIALLFTNSARDEIFKLFAVLYFSLLPAFLYLQFITVRGRTLWEEFVDNLFRLRADEDASLPAPPPHSRFHARWFAARRGRSEQTRTLYQQKFEGVFGTIPSPEAATDPTFPRDKLAPVILATVLLSVGWVVVVMPVSQLDLGWFISSSTDGTHLPLETIRFGFLGAYFYAVQMLVRRYFQNDLKAGAFYNVVMRIVVVALLTWVVDLVYASEPQSTRSVLAFVIGVFPDVGWKAIQATIKLGLRVVVRSLRQQYPLSDLDGLNVWYEARLLEEGIEDMQNLMTCNLVDVMLNTRIPVDRLVDWVDQSLLFLHLGKDEKDFKARETLRRYGIRTATDLEDAFAEPKQDDELAKEHIKRLSRILNTQESEPSVLITVLAALRAEANFHHVRAWRREYASKRESI